MIRSQEKERIINFNRLPFVVQNVPTKGASPDQWIAWYEATKRELGRKNAKILMRLAWEKRGGGEAETSKLREYFAREGLDLTMKTWGGKFDEVFDEVLDFFSISFRWVGIALLSAVALYFIFRFDLIGKVGGAVGSAVGGTIKKAGNQ